MVTANDSKSVFPTYFDNATFGTSGAGGIDSTGEEIVAANPNRQSGVWVQASGATNALIGDATGTATWLVPGNAVITVFVPGKGPVYAKTSAGTTTVNWIEV